MPRQPILTPRSRVRITIGDRSEWVPVETRTVLDEHRCGAPGCHCQQVTLCCSAHQTPEPVHATYDKNAGGLLLTCDACDRWISFFPMRGDA